MINTYKKILHFKFYLAKSAIWFTARGVDIPVCILYVYLCNIEMALWYIYMYISMCAKYLYLSVADFIYIVILF